MNNTGEAILLSVIILFSYAYGFNYWFIPLICMTIFTWTYAGFKKEREEEYRLSNKKMQLEILLLEKKLK